MRLLFLTALFVLPLLAGCMAPANQDAAERLDEASAEMKLAQQQLLAAAEELRAAARELREANEKAKSPWIEFPTIDLPQQEPRVIVTPYKTRTLGAEIKEVHASPMLWCGVFSTFQGVSYRVDSVDGKACEPYDCLVYHALAGAPYCDPKAPRLREDLFHEGARMEVRVAEGFIDDLICWGSEGEVRRL